ncbi:MAG: PKD domain-containing protein [Bacteroidota bacterium]
MPRYFLHFLFVLLLLPTMAKATHIVGGEMNYTCLGNNQYEITLTIFRDCFYGNPAAWFDNPASVGVFDVDNNLLQDIRMTLMNNDTLAPVLSSICFVVPPDVCVHTTTYRDTIELLPRIGGYQLAYQRCCRNQTIVNIIDPLDSGATYGVTISERALLECNSNAKFQEWPPLYICVDEPILFDQSAIDVDGDSIVYKLCTPLLGATPATPQPQPPNNPPYAPINWESPFGVDNMLNGFPGDEELAIDPQTGLLTGLPNTQGQFVVGICVEEYRDGELISTTRRDFQYNVGVCGRAVSAFFAPSIQCESFTVDFRNESLNADDFLWQFNDPNNPGAFSTEPNPSYTFQDTGRYTIALIAEPGTICQDTAFQEVYIQENSLFPDFFVDFIACSDSLTLQVNDLTIDTISNPATWLWEVLPQGLESAEQNPTFSFTSSEIITLRLTVTAENGCDKVFEQTVPIELVEEELLADTVTICLGDEVFINPIFNSSYRYNWEASPWIGNSLNPNPQVSPDTTTTFRVTITDADEFCRIEREITVAVLEELTLDLPDDFTTCDPEVLLTVSGNRPGQFFWDTTPAFATVFSEEDTVVVEPFGQMDYYVLLRDEFGCTATDSVRVVGNGINGEILGNTVRCLQDTFGLFYMIEDVTDTLSYSWSPTDAIIIGEQTRAPILSYTDPGTFTLFVDLENQLGCTLMDSVELTILDTEFQEDFVVQTQCSGFTVQFVGTSVNAPFFVWDFGDPAAPNAGALGAETIYTYPEAGTYEVMVTLSPEVECPDTLLRSIMVGEPAINLDFDWEYVSCGDSAVVQFNDLSVNTQSSFLSRTWEFSTGLQSTDANPQLTIYESTVITATLVLTSDDGCVDSLTQTFPIEVLVETLSDTLVSCPREGVSLNPDFNAAYLYEWSPPDFLDDPSAPNPTAIPTDDQLYVVRISNAEQTCFIGRAVFVQAPMPITYTLSQDTTTCASPVPLFANSPQEVIYEWSADSLFQSIVDMGANIELAVSNADTVYVRLTDAFGCQVRDEVAIDNKGIDVFLNAEQTICIGDTAQLEVANRSDNPISIDWSPESGLISGQGTGIVLVSPAESTTYNVAISNEFGCQLDTTIALSIFNFVPPLAVDAQPDTLLGPGQVDLSATDDLNYNYTWMPPAFLNDATIANPLANINETTTFDVQIRDQNGCVNSRSVTVVVLPLICDEPNIFVPSGFTPDNDGLNDQLFVRGNIVDQLYFVIYNRWGQKVFETRDQNVGWDGRFEEKELSSDVFGYYLQVECIGGELYSKKGNITLIR